MRRRSHPRIPWQRAGGTRSRSGLRALAVSVAIVLSACSQAPRVVDGFPIGDRADCEQRCQRFVDVAVAWLDQTVPGHPTISRTDLWNPNYRTAAGDQVSLSRSGGTGDYVAVMSLADGTVRAIHVACGSGLDPDRCSTVPLGTYGGR